MNMKLSILVTIFCVVAATHLHSKETRHQKVTHHSKKASSKHLKHVKKSVANATRRDSLGFLKAFTDVLKKKIDTTLNIDLEGEKHKDYHVNDKKNQKKSTKPSNPSKPLKKIKNKKTKKIVKKVEQKDDADDFDDDIDLDDDNDMEGSTSAKTQTNQNQDNINAEYGVPKTPAAINYEVPNEGSNMKAAKTKLATQTTEGALLAPVATTEVESGSGSAEDNASGSSGADEGAAVSNELDQNKALNGQALPQVSPQQIQDNSAQSSSPVSNFPVPPMIPIPLFYNSGEATVGSGASGLSDIKATKDLADGVGESGDGEYAKPSGDWVSRILSKKKQKHKYEDEDDEDDGFDEDEQHQQQDNERWMVNSKGNSKQQQSKSSQQQVYQQQQQQTGQVTQASQGSHTSYEYHYDVNTPPKVTYTYQSYQVPPHTDTYSYSNNYYVPPDYYHPQVYDPYAGANPPRQDANVAAPPVPPVPAVVNAQSTYPQQTSKTWESQPAAPQASFGNQVTSPVENIAQPATATGIAAPYVPEDNKYSTGECAATCPATCAPVCDAACCRGSITTPEMSPAQPQTQTSQWKSFEDGQGVGNAQEDYQYSEDAQNSQQAPEVQQKQQAWSQQSRTPPQDQIYPPPSSSIQTPKTTPAKEEVKASTNYVQPKPFPSAYDKETLNPAASTPARDAVEDVNIHPRENYPTNTENKEDAKAYEDEEANNYEANSASNTASNTAANYAPASGSSLAPNGVPVPSNPVQDFGQTAPVNTPQNFAPNPASNMVPNYAQNVAPNSAQQNFATGASQNIGQNIAQNLAQNTPETKQAFQFNAVNPSLANTDNSNRNFAFQPVKPIMLKVPSLAFSINKNNNKDNVRYPAPHCMAVCQSKCLPYCSNECCGINT
ncbi:uncharacterized protein LOC130622363 [Hydractinia symbiolongicarpus]|uniref:uncharacterized protein LOC130622363 n=1 Tax=Hydractinia symbiolongicarpus TaxID=13093 RepID=UPI00254EBF65|nr:uncharacterized protein LOC130622363 [Hydractinia symbiolongicarpus]